MKWMVLVVLFAISCNSDKLSKENELLKARTTLLVDHQNVSDSLCNPNYGVSKYQLEQRRKDLRKRIFDVEHELAKLKFDK